jgi:Replication-relaxation
MTRRISPAQLAILGRQLGEREQRLLRLVAQLRLISHSQLAAILEADEPSQASASSRARNVRRLLARLTEERLLARLSRRVGGVRAGSSGFTYYLGPVGQRLIAYWNGDGMVRGRRWPDPGLRYIEHRLAISGLYGDLFSAHRVGALELVDFAAEPDCWRHYIDRFGAQAPLKPDAFVRIGLGQYLDNSFVEVDLGTESGSVIARKTRAYCDYFRTGAEQEASGVFPRVVFITNSEIRRKRIVEICARLPAEAWQLFSVTTLDKAVDVLSGRLPDPGRGRSES